VPARGADREARLWLSGLLFFVAFYSLHLPLASRLLATGFAGWQVGLILGALGPAALAGRIVAGPLADGIGGPRLMAAGAGLLALSAIVFSDSRSFPVLILARTLQALGYAAFSTAAAAVAGVLAPGEESIPALSRQGTAANVAMAATTWLLASRPSPDQPLHTWAALLACLGGALAFRLPAQKAAAPRNGTHRHGLFPVPRACRRLRRRSAARASLRSRSSRPSAPTAARRPPASSTAPASCPRGCSSAVRPLAQGSASRAPSRCSPQACCCWQDTRAR